MTRHSVTIDGRKKFFRSEKDATDYAQGYYEQSGIFLGVVAAPIENERRLSMTEDEWLVFVNAVTKWQREDDPALIRVCFIVLNQVSVQPR